MRLMMLAASAVLLGAGMAVASDPGERLRAAAARGDVAQTQSLLAEGAPVDAADREGRTPLYFAVARGSTETAEVLVAAGADINAQSRNKDTPWMLAGARGHAAILKVMIPKGPDFRLRNRFGGNALIPACERGHVEAAAVLLTTAIDVNHVNDLGWTCLLEIVILGDGGPRHAEVARMVLSAGADPNIADRDGVTPLQHARRRGQADVARLIEAHGGR